MTAVGIARVPGNLAEADTITLPVFDAENVVNVLTDPRLTAEQKMAIISPSVPFKGEAAERAVEHLSTAAGLDPEDVATAHQLSAFLADPDTDPVSKASIRAGITRMIKIAEATALLARYHPGMKAAVEASNLPDEEKRERLARLAEYDSRTASVVFRCVSEEEDNTALWKAFASGARVALGGDDTAEAWRAAPVDPLEGEALAEYLTQLRAEMGGAV